jgi:hypothetical protein
MGWLGRKMKKRAWVDPEMVPDGGCLICVARSDIAK